MAAIPSFDCRRCALFLDFDGTLVEIAPRPCDVFVEPRTRALLGLLADLTGGAVAIVSGRPIEEIDMFVAPLRLAVAGSHGAELRATPDAELERAEGSELLRTSCGPINVFAARHDLLVEQKAGAISLHYRNRPEHGGDAIALVEGLAAGDDRLRVIDGNMVVELALAGTTKGSALEYMLERPPFAGRTPIAVGDDATDEDAFAAALGRGGQAVKVGMGPTFAPHRAKDVAAVHSWLERNIREAGVTP